MRPDWSEATNKIAEFENRDKKAIAREEALPNQSALLDYWQTLVSHYSNES
jgi:hypothetical protein